MAKSTYLAGKTLAHNTGETAFTMPATPYLALYTTDPTVANSGTEVSGGSYAREAITFTDGDNDSEITFTEATGSWGTVTHFGILDAVSAGNLLYFGAVDSAQAVASGNVARFAVGQISITES